MRTQAEIERFVEQHTVWARPELVPELTLRLATEVTPLWHATEGWLAQHGCPPPFWAFAWAGGQVLARALLDRPELVAGLRVLDFASGSGLCAIAAARAGAASVRAVDIDPFAACACRLNAAENGVAVRSEQVDIVGAPLVDVDVLVAGDIFYDAGEAARYLPWLRAVAGGGVTVLVGEPGRAYAPGGTDRVLYASSVPTTLDLEGRTSRQGRVLCIEAHT